MRSRLNNLILCLRGSMISITPKFAGLCDCGDNRAGSQDRRGIITICIVYNKMTISESYPI